MQQRLSIITITVSDLARSRAFYRDVFGWTETNPEEAIAFFQLPGFMFALYPLAGMAEEHGAPVGLPQGFTLAHNLNSKEEVDELYAGLVERGATGVKEPEEVSGAATPAMSLVPMASNGRSPTTRTRR